MQTLNLHVKSENTERTSRKKRSFETTNGKHIVIWTWNIQKARVKWPKRYFVEILRVLPVSQVEVALLSELLEPPEGLVWVQLRQISCDLLHGNRSAVFLRGM